MSGLVRAIWPAEVKKGPIFVILDAAAPSNGGSTAARVADYAGRQLVPGAKVNAISVAILFEAVAESYCKERAFVWIKVQCYECQKDEPWFYGDSWLRWKRRGKAKWVWLDNYSNPMHRLLNGTLRGVDAKEVPDSLRSAVKEAGGDKVIEACK